MSTDYKEDYNLKSHEADRIIGMAWEDRTPFEAIEVQFGLSEDEVIDFMRRNLKEKSFRRWRRRVSGRETKHRKLRKDEVNRFVSPAQNPITNNRISKKKYS
ncbi:TIGR03643 family protein [Rhodohalobacter sulfatireducens]|uniref:TIGR03643 family protein n=1 Tax=Rhodohalobacter sulfatireducens TaxID=2911366 RepID=A0ABS9KGL8_9BACT|nr:TIGR03643 family protein [Rhodohalobacter sulfatireducens]MCG2589971.1 TIGR03643 family protein [Rhodohalobacter sulfatireducens]